MNESLEKDGPKGKKREQEALGKATQALHLA